MLTHRPCRRILIIHHKGRRTVFRRNPRRCFTTHPHKATTIPFTKQYNNGLTRGRHINENMPNDYSPLPAMNKDA